MEHKVSGVLPHAEDPHETDVSLSKRCQCQPEGQQRPNGRANTRYVLADLFDIDFGTQDQRVAKAVGEASCRPHGSLDAPASQRSGTRSAPGMADG